ncbi:hypothetical protein [Streptomyces sp. NPDC058373]|uniref:hypothetical protein n=1 Tax=Streptomyces sp. NPDC058373 TaxID=3346465 RepID=UPI00365DD54C
MRWHTAFCPDDPRSSPLTEDADHLAVTPIEGLHPTPSLAAMVSAVQAIVAELGASADRPRAIGWWNTPGTSRN